MEVPNLPRSEPFTLHRGLGSDHGRQCCYTVRNYVKLFDFVKREKIVNSVTFWRGDGRV